MEGRRSWKTSVTIQEKYNQSNLTSVFEMLREEVGDGVTPGTLVYTFDHSRSRRLGGTNQRGNQESAPPSALTPPASARGAVVVNTKPPPLAERNHPSAVTFLQSPNGSNIDYGGRWFLVWQATIAQPSDERRERYRNSIDNHRHCRASSDKDRTFPCLPLKCLHQYLFSGVSDN